MAKKEMNIYDLERRERVNGVMQEIARLKEALASMRENCKHDIMKVGERYQFCTICKMEFPDYDDPDM